jgi:PAS domain S-box-containing protein
MGVKPEFNKNDTAVLLITNDPAITDIFYTAFSILKKDNCRIETITGYDESLREIERNLYNIIFFDIDILESGGLMGIKDILVRRPSASLVVLISEEKQEIPNQAISAGALDYIIKNKLSVDIVSQVLTRALLKTKSAENDLSEYDLFMKLAEIVPDPVVITDLKGKIIYLSERAVQLYGSPFSDDVLGTTVFGILIPGHRKKAIENFRTLLSEGYSENNEYEIVKKDASTVFVQLNAALLKDEEGNPKATIFTVRDITSKQSMEKELISSSAGLKHEVDERTIELAKTNEKLRLSIERYRKAEYLTNILYDLALALCLSTNLDDALRLAVDAAILVSRMDCGGIYMWDDGEKGLDLAFQRGHSPDFIRDVIHYDLESETVQLMMSGKPVYSLFNNIGITLTPACSREGLKAVALIPLIHSGKMIGALNVASKIAEDVPFIIRQSLETIAVQVSGIIARFKAERVVSKSEVKLRAQFNSIPVPTYVWEEENGELILKDFNEAANSISSGSLGTEKGTKASSLADNYQDVYKEFLRCFKEKTASEREVVYRYKTTGEQKILLLKMAYVPDNQMLLHTTDITEKKHNEEMLKDYSEKLEEKVNKRTAELEKAYNELTIEMEQRKRVEKELSESRERYCSLIEASGDIIGEMDLNGYITYISPEIVDVLGFPSEDIIGKMKLHDLIEQSGQERVENLIRQFWEKPYIIKSVEIPLKRKDGGSMTFEVSAVPIYNEEGILCGVRGIGRDITDRKRVIEDLEKIQQSLEKKASELELINDEFAHYAYVVSHDLKEPLRTIYNSADYLRKELGTVLSQNQEKYFDYLMEAVRISVDYIEALLTLSRIGRNLKPSEEINMNIFFRGLLNTLNLPPDIKVVLPKDLPVIESNSILLQQIFQNLVSNAVKFNNSPEKFLELGWSSEDENFVKFFVKDNGRGIDSANFEKIFLVFEKIHTRDSDEGMGIGLAIVKKAVNQLNGHVYVESRVGDGSTFFVILPCKRSQLEWQGV